MFSSFLRYIYDKAANLRSFRAWLQSPSLCPASFIRALDIEALAKAMYLSKTRLSVKFKEERGMTLSDFILKEKN